MKRYQDSTPRAVAAIAALVMTVLTFGLAIVVPAALAPGGEEQTRTARVVAPAAKEHVTVATIDVQPGS